MCPRAAEARRHERGFTIIEVLVSLAVMAAMAGAIAALSASNARASRALDDRVALAQTARAVETGIPPRAALRPGGLDGEIAGHLWQMQVRPMAADVTAKNAPWVPRSVSIRVRAPSGAVMVLDTVRLVRSGSQ
ncbi:prepilin-type N-terminal cleavage/methylation domain-containing protein [Terrihabitans sp. B22-R8]|uniref:prepilin-type N-terminal cleavage/methylation domain-containing protein n=1 Tax=Terrihabitans sp. B22-R8 TaxID=3425128 RepID=UPI00403C0691